MKVAVIGATGLVGTRMLEVLSQRNFPAREVLVAASEKSIGRKVLFKGQELTVQSVGRLRRDTSLPSALNLWCVSDNLRKGAATNAVQIAELLLRFCQK